MNPPHQKKNRAAQTTRLLVLLALSVGFGAPSCASNEKLEARLDRRTELNAKYQERRSLRNDANDARDAAWYDRVMH